MGQGEAAGSWNIVNVVVQRNQMLSDSTRNRTRRMEAGARYQLPVFPGDDGAVAAKKKVGHGRKTGGTYWQGIEKKRPTMDIKAAFDVARPKLTVIILGEQDIHGWITERQETFEHVEKIFNFVRRIRQGSDKAPTLLLKVAKHI